MITIVQTPDAGTQFNGAGTAGFIDFSQVPIPPGQPDVVPIVTAIALENNAAEQIHLVDCFFVRPGETIATTTQRVTVRREADNEGFSLAGCRIPVPGVVVTESPSAPPTVFTPWPLVLVTTGKTAVASFIVSFQLGKAINGG